MTLNGDLDKYLSGGICLLHTEKIFVIRGYIMDRRVKKTVKAITKAMLKLLCDKPLDMITMTEIAEEADLNRSTIYSYFDNPQGIFDSLASESIRDLELALGDQRYYYSEFMPIYLDVIKKHREIFLEIHRTSIDNVYINQVMDIMNGHLIKKKMPKNQVLTRYYEYGFFGTAADWLKSGCKKPVQELNRELEPVIKAYDDLKQDF